MRYLYVLAGGGVGSVLRYAVNLAVIQRYGGPFPLGTFVVNIAGSFLIGLMLTLFSAHSDLRPLLVTGLLGGFTTFSALEWETFALVGNGLPSSALLNLAGSAVVGYLACWAGAALAQLRR